MAEFLKLYGERNTCTNYLARLLDTYIPLRQLVGTPPRLVEKLRFRRRLLTSGQYEFLSDSYFQFTYPFNLGWKHTSVLAAAALRRYRIVRDDRTFFITVTKNPYAWLLSLYRKPYHQYFDRTLTFEAFLQRPWTLVRRDGLAGESVESPVILWNAKNGSYNQLAAHLPTIQLKSETVQTDPAPVIEDIARRLDVAPRQAVRIENLPSTKDGTKDTDWYRDYYQNEKWREGLSAAAIEIINQSVDRDLMNQYGYSLL